MEFKHYKKEAIILAAPATKAEAKSQGIPTWDFPQFDDDKPGYIYEVNESDKAWLPEEVFNLEHHRVENYIDRMELEYQQLTNKIVSANEFFFRNKTRFFSNEKESEAMLEQISLMSQYAIILAARIESAKECEENNNNNE